MIAIAVTALFAVATIVALGVTASSLRRACSVYGELQRALADCDTRQMVSVTLKAAGRTTAQPRLRSAVTVRRVSRAAAVRPAQRAAA